MSQFVEGEYMPLWWDGDGKPAAYYVKGHVDSRGFAAALAAYFGDDRPSGELTIRRTHARFVRAPENCEGVVTELRECKKGRGAFAVTVADVPGRPPRSPHPRYIRRHRPRRRDRGAGGDSGAVDDGGATAGGD